MCHTVSFLPEFLRRGGVGRADVERINQNRTVRSSLSSLVQGTGAPFGAPAMSSMARSKRVGCGLFGSVSGHVRCHKVPYPFSTQTSSTDPIGCCHPQLRSLLFWSIRGSPCVSLWLQPILYPAASQPAEMQVTAAFGNAVAQLDEDELHYMVESEQAVRDLKRRQLGCSRFQQRLFRDEIGELEDDLPLRALSSVQVVILPLCAPDETMEEELLTRCEGGRFGSCCPGRPLGSCAIVARGRS